MAAICWRLDGVPLAIELAAARLALLPVEEIAARLDDTLGLLAAGSRTALPRHRTLRAAIEWSYDLLLPAEQRLLGRLSVFAGGFTVTAVEAICSECRNHEVLDLLAALIDKSLVASEAMEGGVRHRLLETIRAYTSERLAPDEQSIVERRHAAYYLALAEANNPLQGAPHRISTAAIVTREQENLRAALRLGLRSGRQLRSGGAAGDCAGVVLGIVWPSRGSAGHVGGAARAERRVPHSPENAPGRGPGGCRRIVSPAGTGGGGTKRPHGRPATGTSGRRPALAAACPRGDGCRLCCQQ